MDRLHSQGRATADEFGKALREGANPRIEDFLSRDPNHSALVFAQLLRLDVDYRRERGEVPVASDYLSRFPEFEREITEHFTCAESDSMMSSSTVMQYESQGSRPAEHSSEASFDIDEVFDLQSGDVSVRVGDILGSSPGSQPVSSEDYRSADRVDQISDAFEREWQAGRRPKIEEYLQQAYPADREALFRELVAIDWEFRQRLKEHPNLQDYVSRYPTFAHLLSASSWPGPLGTISARRAVKRSAERPAEVQSGETAAGGSATTISGRYRLEKLLGRGGFAEVWLATDKVLRRQVAVKRPRPDLPERHATFASFLPEAQRVAGLDIPGIVQVFDVCDDEGRYCIVSQFIDGQTLDARMKSGPVPLGEAVETVAQVAEALHRAHLRDVVHRDIKPGNILLDRSGKPFVADFGLAVNEQEQVRERSALLGTCIYMSPEQARGDCHRLDARSDIYSLGVVLYQLLTGRLPFAGRTPSEYIDQILNREVRPPRTRVDTIPPELERICLKCLEKQLGARYTTALDLATDLRKWQASVVPSPGIAPPRKRWKEALIALVALVPILILLTITINRSRNDVPPHEPPQPGVVSTKTRDAWMKALDQLPTEYLPPGETGEGTGEFKEDLGGYQIISPGVKMFTLGKVTANENLIDILISQPVWLGDAGVFVGLHQTEIKGLKRTVFDAFWLENYKTAESPPEFRLYRATYAVGAKANGWTKLIERGYATLTPPPQPNEKCHLQLEYTCNQIVGVYWNGRKLKDLCDEFSNRELKHNDLVGEWGIWQKRGTTRFYNPSFTVVSKSAALP